MRPRKTAKTPIHFLTVKGKDTAFLAFGLKSLLFTTISL
jgi:hypothetical protein